MLIPGISECGVKKSPCCPDCGGHRHDPCCVEWDDLPDSTMPVTAVTLPAIAAIDLPAAVFIIPPAVLVEESVVSAATPIRGPDPPGSRRAILEVWRL